MARIRYLKPDFFSDTTLADLPISTRYLYAGLWPHMDSNGVCEGDPRLVKSWVYPLDEEQLSRHCLDACKQLVKCGRLRVARHEGKIYLHCPTFAKHQKIHPGETKRYDIPEESWSHTWEQPTSNLLATYKQPTDLPLTLTLTSTLTSTNTHIGSLLEHRSDARNTTPTATASPPPVAQKRKEKKRTQAQKDSSTIVIQLFKTRFVKSKGYLPSPWAGKEQGQLTDFSDRSGEDNALAVVNQFFDSSNPHYFDKGYPLDLMIFDAPRLLDEWHNPNHHRFSSVARLADQERAREDLESVKYAKAQLSIDELFGPAPDTKKLKGRDEDER